ncbi:MAG: hypothetical protein WC087_01860 [Candidatus Paceibacterota bacterium]
MIEMPQQQSSNELFSDFEDEKRQIREIAEEMNDRAWKKMDGNAEKFDQWVAMRNEFVADKLKEHGVGHAPEHFAAFHYFIGSGLPSGEGHPFDTEDGLVLKSIIEVSKYL